jgi:hypothetical protein
MEKKLRGKNGNEPATVVINELIEGNLCVGRAKKAVAYYPLAPQNIYRFHSENQFGKSQRD